MFGASTTRLTAAHVTAASGLVATAELDMAAIAVGVPIGVIVLGGIAALLTWGYRSGSISALLKRRRRRD